MNYFSSLSPNQAMRHSFFYLQRQVEVNVMENDGRWRWAYVINGHGPSIINEGLTGTAAEGLQEACKAARTVLAQS